jgi:hypothetical protein
MEPLNLGEATEAINLSTDPALSMGIAESYALDWQSKLSDASFSQDQYPADMNAIEKNADELRYLATKQAAQTIMSPLGVEGANKAWDAVKSGKTEGLDDDQLKAVNQLWGFLKKHPRGYGYSEQFSLTEKGLEGDARELGLITLNQRAGRRTEITIDSSTRNVEQLRKTFTVSSDVGGELERLKQEVAEAKEELAKPDIEVPLTMGGEGAVIADATKKHLARKTIEDNTELIARYSRAGGRRNFEVDQANDKLKEEYGTFFGKEAGVGTRLESVARGTIRSGVSVAAGGAKIGAQLWMLPNRAIEAGLDAAGFETGAEAFRDFREDVLGGVDDGAEISVEGTKDFLKDHFIGIESKRFQGGFLNNVESAVLEELGPFIVQIAATGGSSHMLRTAVAAGRGVSVKSLVGSKAFGYVDDYAAPLFGASIGGVREGMSGWIDSQRTADNLLKKAGFKSVEEATEAGETKLAAKVTKIRDDSNKVFAADSISTSMLEMFAMRRYLGRAGNKMVDQQQDLLKKTIGKKAFDKLMGSLGTGGIEGGTEVGQNVMTRHWARQWIDENRHLFPDQDEAAVEFTVGLIMGTAADFVIGSSDPAQTIKKVVETEASRTIERENLNRWEDRKAEKAANAKAVEEFREEQGAPIEVVKNNAELDEQVVEQASRMIPVQEDIPVEPSPHEQQIAAIKKHLEGGGVKVGDDVEGEAVGLSPSGVAAIDLYLETNKPEGTVDQQAEAILRFLAKAEPQVDPGKESKAREKPVEVKVERADSGEEVEFDNQEEADDFRERQERAAFNKAKRTDKPLTESEVDKSLAAAKKAANKRAEKAAAAEAAQPTPEEAAQAQEEARVAAKEKEAAAVEARAKKKVSDREAGRGQANSSNKNNDPIGFISGAMKYLVNLDGESGTVLRNAFGGKYDSFVLWATDTGTNPLDSPEAATKIEKALRDMSNRGGMPKGHPLVGMEPEIESFREMLESMYRNQAGGSRAKKTTEAASDMNTLFLGRNKRNSTQELKTGEAPSSSREHYVRPATKTGKTQQGYRKESWAVAAARKNPNSRIEKEGDRYYVIDPILTPEVQENLSLTESISNMESPELAPGQLIAPMPDRQAVEDTANARRGFGLGGYGNGYLGSLLSKVNIFQSLTTSDLANAVKAFLEDIYLARNQAFADRMSMRAPFVVKDGQIEGVTAKNGTDSTYVQDVAESLGRGEDNYNMDDATRSFLIGARDRIKQVGDLGQKEGVKLKFINNDPLQEYIDWDLVGIPGYFPHVMDYKATQKKATRDGLTPEQFNALIANFGGKKVKTTGKKGFEHQRKFPTVKEGVEAGIVYKDWGTSFYDYDHGMRTKAAEVRYKNDPRVRKKDSEGVDVMTKDGEPVMTDEAAKALEAASTRTVHPLLEGLKKAATEIKIGLVGGDLGYLAIFLPSVAAVPGAGIPAAIKATYQSILALADPEAVENMVSKTDNQVTLQDMATYGVAIHFDPEFVAGEGQGSVANTASNLAIGAVTLGAIPKADVFNRLGDAFRVFGTVGAFELWKGLTGNLERDASGRILPEHAADAKKIADDINRYSGRFDFKRHGFNDSVSNAATLIMFAPQMAAGFGSQFVKASKIHTKDGRAAARHLTHLMAGYSSFFVLAGLLLGLKKEELLARLNPLTSGSKFLSLPVKYPDGTTDEVSMAGFQIAAWKTIAELSGSLANNFDSLPESVKNDKKLWEPPVKFLKNRRNPLFTLWNGLWREKDFFNQPVPRRQVLLESLLPLSGQELAKRLGNSLGEWIDPDGSHGIYDDDGQMYVDPDVTWKQELGRVLVQMMGMSSYPASVQRENELARDKIALERFGSMYNDLQVDERVRVTDIVEAMPYFAGKRARVSKSGMMMKDRLRNFDDTTDRDNDVMRDIMSDESVRLMGEMQIPFPPIYHSVDIGGNRYVSLTNEERRNLRMETARAIDNTMQELNRDARWNSLSYEPRFKEAENRVTRVTNEVLKAFDYLAPKVPKEPLTPEEVNEQLNKLPEIDFEINLGREPKPIDINSPNLPIKGAKTGRVAPEAGEQGAVDQLPDVENPDSPQVDVVRSDAGKIPQTKKARKNDPDVEIASLLGVGDPKPGGAGEDI